MVIVYINVDDSIVHAFNEISCIISTPSPSFCVANYAAQISHPADRFGLVLEPVPPHSRHAGAFDD